MSVFTEAQLPVARVPSPAWVTAPAGGEGDSHGEETALHRRCHHHSTASGPQSLHPPPHPPLSIHPHSPHPAPVTQGKSCCLGNKNTWGTGRWEMPGLVGAPGPMFPSLAPRSALGLSAVPLPSMQTIPGGWVIPSQNCILFCMPLFICYSKHVSFEFFIQSILASAACLGK